MYIWSNMKPERHLHHGDQLRKLLQENGITASECARRLECTRQAVSKMLRSEELRIGRVRQLIRLFKVPIGYFIGS